MYETAISLLKEINKFGFKAYIVGGYPRDLYMKRQSVDIDICTSARPKDLKKIFKNAVLPKQEYGGLTIVKNNIIFEITTFRKEIKYKDNRFPIKIKYINKLIDDLKRRDFTINTLCIDSNGNMIDLLNAKDDIDKKLIRSIGNSVVKIEEDILRSLRAIRFATVLNFDLDNDLKEVIKEKGYLLKRLSYYRKKEELDKIFASPNCYYGISLIKELNLYNYLELSNLDTLVLTTSTLGIWAQLGVLNIYNFTNHEREIIEGVQKVLREDLLDNYILYKYGLYICTIVGEIKNVDRKIIVAKYNNLPIFSKKDINIKADEISQILNKKPGIFLKQIYNDLEYNILANSIINDNQIIKEYIKVNYDFK